MTSISLQWILASEWKGRSITTSWKLVRSAKLITLRGRDWPVDCAGNLASESGAACNIDIASIAKQILKNEAQQQMQDTIEEKARSFIKKLFGD